MTPSLTVFTTFVGILLAAAGAGMLRTLVWAVQKKRHGLPLLPEAKSRRVPWGLGSVVLTAVLYIGTNLVVSEIYRFATAEPATTAQGGADKLARARDLSLTEQMLLLSMINGIVIISLPLMLQATARARLADLGLVREGLLRHAWEGVVAFLLVTPAVYGVNLFATLIWKPHTHPVEKMVRGNFSGGIVYLAMISAVLLAPVAEELIFRGVLQGWLAWLGCRPRRDGDPELFDVVDVPSDLVAARAENAEVAEPDRPRASVNDINHSWSRDLAPIAFTSLMFAAVHIPQWPAPLALFLLSMALGVLYQRTGSLVGPMVLHALFNAIGTLALFQVLLTGAPAEKPVPPLQGAVASAQHGGGPTQRDSDRRGVENRSAENSARFPIGASEFD